jgi:hypothetical protein
LLRRAKLTDTEVNEIKALFTANPDATGIANVTTALLLGRTLYMYETNVTARTQLKPRELADRLSTLIWGMPAADKTLLDKAYANGLNTVDALRTEALRMLNDPKAQGGLRAFYDGYLGLDKNFRIEGKDTNPNTDTGADFTVTYNNVSAEIMRFASHLTVRTEGTFSDLLLSPKAFVDSKMASVYGVPASALTNAPTYLNAKEVTLNTRERAGLYTRTAFVASGGGKKVGLSSPTQRGEHFLKMVLCEDPPKLSPEQMADIQFPSLPDPNVMSWVEVLKEIHLKDNDNNPATPNDCVLCHTAIDPIGFAFENYTLNGQYITQYPNGFPVDASGWFEPLQKQKDYDDKSFNNALELSEILASSDNAAQCFSRSWLNYGLARQVKGSNKDHCAAEQLADNFKTKNYSLRELILEVVSNPSFRFRNPE